MPWSGSILLCVCVGGGGGGGGGGLVWRFYVATLGTVSWTPHGPEIFVSTEINPTIPWAMGNMAISPWCPGQLKE